jgi:preprotein translocase subunit Sec61beta
MSSRVGIAVFTLSIIMSLVPTTGAASHSEGVSPGAIGRIAEIEGRCPTFFWGGERGAIAYELVVYRLPEEALLSSSVDIDLTTCEEVLYARVPGGATAWQPELADALHPGGGYVWFVRAVLREDRGEVLESGEWSSGRFFSISPVVTAGEVEQALSVLRQYMDQSGSGSSVLDPQGFEQEMDNTGRLTTSRHGAPATQDQKSVPTATSAILGSVPDSSGETYGVVGISNSPDGAGVGAANTAGGPDLVLDGSEDFLPDAELSESGINRPSGTPQTFNIQNSMGAGLTLQVDGVDVITTDSGLDADNLTSGLVSDGRLSGSYSQPLTLGNSANVFTGEGTGLTGVDADTLDGTDGAAFATELEAAAFVAAHAASADHDGRYYTETELNTAGAGGAVDWGNLTAVPAGFADGVDDNTTYSPGPGLIIDGGQIRIDPAAFSTRISTLDSVGFVGFYTSIAIGADGLGLISSWDGTNSDLKVAHCVDTACTSAITNTLDSGGSVGKHTSIAIGADGLGLISYYDDSSDDLKVAHCVDTACSSATTATIDSGGTVGEYTSIAIGTDGLGLISYFDRTDDDLKVAHCNNTACTSATTTTLDSDGGLGRGTSIAIGADGLGLISYYDSTNSDLKVAHCNDTACSNATTAYVDIAGTVGTYNSIAIGADGLGLISYFDATNEDLKVAHCVDALCSSATTITLDSAGDVGFYTSIAIGADGLGLISYYDSTNGDLKVAHCDDTACTGVSTATLVNGGSVGSYNSIAIGADGLGLISCREATNDDLKAVHLGIGVP